VSEVDPIQLSSSPGSSDSGAAWWIREAILATGLVILLLSSMWIATGTFPPMVVVESKSMMHDEDGDGIAEASIGTIDPGDLVLVMSPERVEVVTFVESTDESSEDYGYESHGMPGDVIIYRKNGGSETPVIHRALLEVKHNQSGGWDVPGTTLRNVETVTLTLDYECTSFHRENYQLTIEDWEPSNEGYLTAGDNNLRNDCMIDQPSANSRQGMGLSDSSGHPVLVVKHEWVVGVASSEIPWIGAIKLLTSGSEGDVTSSSWTNLTLTIALILASPIIFESASAALKQSEEEE